MDSQLVFHTPIWSVEQPLLQILFDNNFFEALFFDKIGAPKHWPILYLRLNAQSKLWILSDSSSKATISKLQQ